MPKQKTSKTVLKRFKFTKTGKILRGHQYAGHLRSKKSKKRIRNYKEVRRLSNKQASIIRALVNR